MGKGEGIEVGNADGARVTSGVGLGVASVGRIGGLVGSGVDEGEGEGAM
jgi:hypothetical protein